MELDRIKLSYAERRYRTENNLCIACGEKGHFARDHHRKNDRILIPRRHTTQPYRGQQSKNHPPSYHQFPSVESSEKFYSNPNPQSAPQSFSQSSSRFYPSNSLKNLPLQNSQPQHPALLRTLEETHVSKEEILDSTPSSERGLPYESDKHLKGLPLV